MSIGKYIVDFSALSYGGVEYRILWLPILQSLVLVGVIPPPWYFPGMGMIRERLWCTRPHFRIFTMAHRKFIGRPRPTQVLRPHDFASKSADSYLPQPNPLGYLNTVRSDL